MSVFAGRRARRGLAVAVVVFAGAALPASASAGAEDCNPLALATCLAPFPSNHWADADPSSPTGLRADIDDELLRPELLRQLPAEDGITPSQMFNGQTGFSAGMGAFFEFTERQAAPPSDGGDIVTAFDLDAGARVPVHAFMSAHAHDPDVVGNRPSNVLQVFPRARWPFGHRIVVAVSTAMGASDPAFPELARRADPGTKAADYVADVASALRAAGLDPAEVRTATLFTVRDRDEAIAPTERLLKDTSGRPHPTRDVRLQWNLATPATAGLVTGRVRLDNYRTRDGHGPIDPSGATRKDQWAPFQLTLPRSAGTRPAPVVIYAHGLGMSKETDVLVSTMNARLGLATISIDWPNHGVRSTADGGFIFDLMRPGELGTLSGLFNQATIDMMGLYRAIGTLDLDVVRRPTWRNWSGRGADGRPDLDTTSISMQGTSLGGVLGANFAALAPKLDAIDFHVTGVGLSHIVSQSILWPSRFTEAMPAGRTGTEDALMQAAIQQELDPADAINTVDLIRTPRAGQAKKPLLLILGMGDAVVTNPASIAMANLLDLPLNGPERFPMPGVRVTADPDPDGYAMRQYPPLIGPVPPIVPGLQTLSGESAHGAFAWPDAFNAQASFLRRFGPRP
jgi:hypothetical protein